MPLSFIKRSAAAVGGPTAYSLRHPYINKPLLATSAAFLYLVLLVAAPSKPAWAAEEIRLLVLGDSLTAGFGLPQSDGFVERLDAELGERFDSVRVINGGVSGDTTAGGLTRLDWSLADQPTHAIVELGANDGLRGIDPKVTYRNLDAIISRLKGEGVEVFLAGMLAPPNMGPEYEAEFNAIYPDLAEKHDIPLYPFFLDGVATVASLNQGDGIHPNAEGVRIIVDRMAPYVIRWLEEEGR